MVAWYRIHHKHSPHLKTMCKINLILGTRKPVRAYAHIRGVRRVAREQPAVCKAAWYSFCFFDLMPPPVYAMTMSRSEPVRLVSINVKGLNTPKKRSMVLANLKHMKAHFCFIQETHFRAAKIPRLRDHFFLTAYHGCSPDSKSKGVSILICGTTQWLVKDQWNDEEGRALFVKGMLGNSLVTLVNL